MQAVEITAKKITPIPHKTLQHPDYPVHVGLSLIQKAGSLIQTKARGQRLAVIADENAMKHHGETLFASLSEHFFLSALVLPSGESAKTPETLMAIVDFLAASELCREDMLITFGGGVTGDLGGFAAAIYMRGLDYIHIPTTLMAQIDSSIGGKVGVNLKSGKNLLGSFHNPKMVIVDPNLLRTLPQTEWQSGTCELIKYAFTLDAKLLDLIPQAPPADETPKPHQWLSAIERAIALKIDIVVADPTEQGKRKVLNFGHTIGHGLENLMGYGAISHGKAVAQGMLAETQYALSHFGGEKGLLEKLEKTLRDHQLEPLDLVHGYSEQAWSEALKRDKKTNAQGVEVIWPKSLGSWTSQRTELKNLATFAEGVWS